jgi:YD repeat-containing protein
VCYFCGSDSAAISGLKAIEPSHRPRWHRNKSYDDYGNVTNNGSQGFTYNLAGNLTSSTSSALSYKYDGHKRRVQKTEAGQTSYTVVDLHDGLTRFL